MTGKFIGLKHIQGTKDGRGWSMDIACLTTSMSERDANNGAKGDDVHSVGIPDRYKELFVEKNLGKDFEVELYYANKRENLAYAALAK